MHEGHRLCLIIRVRYLVLITQVVIFFFTFLNPCKQGISRSACANAFAQADLELLSLLQPGWYFSQIHQSVALGTIISSILNSFLASGDFPHLLITIAHSLDPDQNRLNVRSDLDPNDSVTERIYEKLNLEKK